VGDAELAARARDVLTRGPLGPTLTPTAGR